MQRERAARLEEGGELCRQAVRWDAPYVWRCVGFVMPLVGLEQELKSF